jgi:hypothetical protein
MRMEKKRSRRGGNRRALYEVEIHPAPLQYPSNPSPIPPLTGIVTPALYTGIVVVSGGYYGP